MNRSQRQTDLNTQKAELCDRAIEALRRAQGWLAPNSEQDLRTTIHNIVADHARLTEAQRQLMQYGDSSQGRG